LGENSKIYDESHDHQLPLISETPINFGKKRSKYMFKQIEKASPSPDDHLRTRLHPCEFDTIDVQELLQRIDSSVRNKQRVDIKGVGIDETPYMRLKMELENDRPRKKKDWSSIIERVQRIILFI
jgi:hypothetical protein